MWEVLEHRQLDRQLAKAPREVLKRYEKWKDIARLSGPPGVRLIKGFQWRGQRSCRLGDQWRVMYRVVPERLTYAVESITPHDDRRK